MQKTLHALPPDLSRIPVAKKDLPDELVEVLLKLQHHLRPEDVPKPSTGFVMVYHVLSEVLMRAPLTGTQWRVYLVFLRLIEGIKENRITGMAKISSGTFERMTGLNRGQVSKAQRVLGEFGMVVKVLAGTGRRPTLWFIETNPENLDFSEEAIKRAREASEGTRRGSTTDAKNEQRPVGTEDKERWTPSVGPLGGISKVDSAVVVAASKGNSERGRA